MAKNVETIIATIYVKYTADITGDECVACLPWGEQEPAAIDREFNGLAHVRNFCRKVWGTDRRDVLFEQGANGRYAVYIDEFIPSVWQSLHNMRGTG